MRLVSDVEPIVVTSTTVWANLDARHCASSDSSIRREVAVARVGSVYPTRLTCRNEPDGDALCLDSAFVSDDVQVVTTLNKRHPRCVHGPRAGGIVPLIGRHRSRRDHDQGVAKMRVPACGSSRLPNIVQDIPVRQSLRLLPRQPDVAPIHRRDELIKGLEFGELALGDRCTCELVRRCRHCRSCMKEGRDHHPGTQHEPH